MKEYYQVCCSDSVVFSVKFFGQNFCLFVFRTNGINQSCFEAWAVGSFPREFLGGLALSTLLIPHYVPK